MRSTLVPFGTAALITLLACAIAAPVSAQDVVRKPLLSEEIRAVLEKEGPEAAQRRFDEIFPAKKDQYEVDMQGIAALGAQYIQSGDAQKAEVVMNMANAVTTDMMQAYGMPAAAARPDPRATTEEPEPATEERSIAIRPLGPPRDDLRRFRGQYGPARGEGRNLFVAETCDGYLTGGATWGDAANWHLISVTDNAFEMDDAHRPEPLRIDFEVGPDGNVQAMSHNLEGIPTPLPYLGPLPEEWGDECMVVRRGR